MLPQYRAVWKHSARFAATRPSVVVIVPACVSLRVTPRSVSLCVSHCVSRFPARSDFDSLDEKDLEKNNQLAFDVAEREFCISPCMTGKEMSSVVEPDKLSMVMYLSQFYEMFKDTVPPGGESGALQQGCDGASGSGLNLYGFYCFVLILFIYLFFDPQITTT